jgi:TolB protein
MKASTKISILCLKHTFQIAMICLALPGNLVAQRWLVAPEPVAAVHDAYPSISSQGRVVFQSNRIGGSRLFIVDSLEGTPRLLPTGGDQEVTAVWSPSGEQVMFASTRGDTEDIYVVNFDGTGERRLTQHAASDSHPKWSPDGRRVVFCSTRGDGENDDIFVMNIDGTDVRRLTDNGLTWDTFPSFSPDGRKILFRQLYRIRLDLGITAINSEIMLMNTDGSGLTNLSRDAWFDGWPSWSPDGRRIAFSSNRSDVYQIYVMDADGRNVQVVAPSPYVQVRPQWAPDGRWVIFNQERDGGIQLMLAPVPGH